MQQLVLALVNKDIRLHLLALKQYLDGPVIHIRHHPMNKDDLHS
jgi:hypothetical protein